MLAAAVVSSPAVPVVSDVVAFVAFVAVGLAILFWELFRDLFRDGDDGGSGTGGAGATA